MVFQANKPSSDTKFALSLALITLLAPVATDMYLASMTKMADSLNTSYANIQLTLTVYLLAQGVGQLFFGPLIDRFGRRGPLLAGLGVFILSSICSGFANSLPALIACRSIQGLSGALTLVIGFSSVRDVAEGVRAARLFAVLMTIEGLAPIFAPIAGGYLDTHFGWRVVLWASAAMGAAALVNSFFSLGETLPKDQRIPLQPAITVKTYKRILLDRAFLLPVLGLSGMFFFLFAYISGGPYLYQKVFGLSSDLFGIVFGITGVSVMLGAIISSRLVKTRKVVDVALLGLVLVLCGTAAAAVAAHIFGLYGLIPCFMLTMFGLGIAEPTLISLTMASQKTALGFTAALMGCMHLSLASLSTPISGYLMPLGTGYWFIFLIASAALTLAITLAARADLRKGSSQETSELAAV